MAEEEKKVEETTEAPVEEAKEEKKGKKKDKKSVDVNALVGKAKDGINQGSSKLTAVVKEADDKKKMLIFLIIIALEVVLSLMGGVNPFCLILEIIVALAGYIALKAAFPASSDAAAEEDKKEE